jgi:phospholipase C
LIAVSPFSKPSYVSHTIGDHTSMLALIERRFLTINGVTQHVTSRDEHANALEDMFDLDHSPSLNTEVGRAAPPVNDCTPPKAP